MKRISFFLGVFSVGLVVFLLLTGQFGGIGASEEETTTGDAFPEVTRNRVTHHSYDYTLGRLRFTLRGLMELSSGVVLSSENLISQRTLIDATIELPVYAEGRTEPVDQILLEAEKIITDPGGEEARVVGLLRGQGVGGIPQMETRDLVIRWADGEDIQMKTGHMRFQNGRNNQLVLRPNGRRDNRAERQKPPYWSIPLIALIPLLK